MRGMHRYGVSGASARTRYVRLTGLSKFRGQELVEAAVRLAGVDRPNAPLWLERLSMMTMSPGYSSGSSTRST